MIQLEYLVADAKSKGCDTLVSVGGVQSNHTRAVTATATASGMKGMSSLLQSGIKLINISGDRSREGVSREAKKEY